MTRALFNPVMLWAVPAYLGVRYGARIVRGILLKLGCR